MMQIAEKEEQLILKKGKTELLCQASVIPVSCQTACLTLQFWRWSGTKLALFYLELATVQKMFGLAWYSGSDTEMCVFLLRWP